MKIIILFYVILVYLFLWWTESSQNLSKRLQRIEHTLTLIANYYNSYKFYDRINIVIIEYFWIFIFLFKIFIFWFPFFILHFFVYFSLIILFQFSIFRKGFLTRRQLTSGPEFGVTLGRADQLDGFHVIFGIVLEGQEVLDAITLIPTYSYKTKTGTIIVEKNW